MGIHVEDTRTGVSAHHARPEPVGPRTRSPTRRRARPEHLEDGRRTFADATAPGSAAARPTRTASATRWPRRSRAPRYTTAGRQRHPGAAEHHADRRATRSGSPRRAGSTRPDQTRSPRPATSSPRSKSHRLRHHAQQLQELVARLLGQVVRAVLQRRRRRRLPGERLLPGDVHDRRRAATATTRSTSSTACSARPRTSTKWSNGYWYWNQRDVYNSFLASNHADLMATFNRLYSRNYAALKAYTQTRYGIDALWVPETMGWDGNARGTVGSDYVNDIYSTGTEAAYNMYLQYRYTNDTAYLQNTVYPYMRDVAAVLPEPVPADRTTASTHGQLQRPRDVLGRAQRDHRPGRGAAALPARPSRSATQLGLDSGLRAGWQDLLDNLHAVPGGQRRLPAARPADLASSATARTSRPS